MSSQELEIEKSENQFEEKEYIVKKKKKKSEKSQLNISQSQNKYSENTEKYNLIIISLDTINSKLPLYKKLDTNNNLNTKIEFNKNISKLIVDLSLVNSIILFRKQNLQFSNLNSEIIFEETNIYLPINLPDLKKVKLEIKNNISETILFKQEEETHKLPELKQLLFPNVPILALSDLNTKIIVRNTSENNIDVEDNIDEEEIEIDFYSSCDSSSTEDGKIKEIIKKLLKIAGNIKSNRSNLLIILQPSSESYTEFFEHLSKLCYRVEHGGFPQPLIISPLEELKPQLRLVDDETIVSIKIKINDEKDFDKIFSDERLLKLLVDKINQLYSRSFSVFILSFYINNEKYNEIKDKILGKIKILIHQLIRRYIKPEIIIVNSDSNDTQCEIYNEHHIPKLTKEEKIEIINKLLLTRITRTENLPPSFGKIFEHLLRYREEFINLIQKLRNGLYFDITEPNSGNESKEHRALKTVIAFYLTHKLIKLGIIKKEEISYSLLRKYIKSEYPLGENRADIYFKPDRSTFEIETLYGEDVGGSSIRDKIRQTILKYRDCYDVENIYLVFDPLTYNVYKKEILGVIKNIRNEIGKKLYVTLIRIKDNKLRLMIKEIK